MTLKAPTSVDICTDCLFLLANGEGPDDVAEALALRWPVGTLTLGRLGGDPDDESWFSWSACEGCGSDLGGDRHAATGWVEVTRDDLHALGVADQPTEGDAVTLDVPGAWHYGQAGRVLATSTDTGITVVIFPNNTTVAAPTAVVRPA